MYYEGAAQTEAAPFHCSVKRLLGALLGYGLFPGGWDAKPPSCKGQSGLWVNAITAGFVRSGTLLTKSQLKPFSPPGAPGTAPPPHAEIV